MAIDPMMMQMLLSQLGGGGGGGQQGGMGGGMMGMSSQMGTTALGAMQTIGSLIMLNKLRKTPRARFGLTPEMQQSASRANQMAQGGFTGQEEANYLQNLSQMQNASFQNARQMSGGGLGRAISGGLSSQRIGALNQFAGQDASLMRQNVRYADQRGDVITQQRNRQTGEDIRYRDMQEQAIGRSLQAGTTNLASSMNATQALGGNQGGGFGGGNMSGGGQGGFKPPAMIQENIYDFVPPQGGMGLNNYNTFG